MDDETLDIAKTAVKEVANDLYNDCGKPVAKPTGELLGLVPRSIKAALLPVEKWVIGREYNLEETRKLLEAKLDGIDPEMIDTPEAYIAVPAIQYISYCMDSEELRDMYANLLANSMNKIVKDGVHPGFVEIIKQLSPDEAKLLEYFFRQDKIPTLTVKCHCKEGGSIDLLKDFSDLCFITNCENPQNIQSYFDNLVRLGLLEKAPSLSSLSDKSQYDSLKKHPLIQSFYFNEDDFGHISLEESYIMKTAFGTRFCNICLNVGK